MKKIVFILMLVSSFSGISYFGARSVEARVQDAVTTNMKGVIKKIDDASIVVTPSSNKKAEVTFQLTSSAKRSGAVAAGDTVVVTYYYDKGNRVVTAIAGKAK